MSMNKSKDKKVEKNKSFDEKVREQIQRENSEILKFCTFLYIMGK